MPRTSYAFDVLQYPTNRAWLLPFAAFAALPMLFAEDAPLLANMSSALLGSISAYGVLCVLSILMGWKNFSTWLGVRVEVRD